MIRRKFVILPLMAAILMMAAACGNELNPETETPATSAETDPSLEPTRGQATVDNIDVVVLESFPVGVNVIVSGNLPDSCTRIDQAIAQQTGSTFQGVVTTVREPDTAGCTMALSPFETTIPLDVDGLEAGTYIVDVNGVQDSFTLDVDNVAATDPASAEPTPTLAPTPEAEGTTSEIGGLVFHDVCAGTGLPTDELAEGCVTDALGSPVGR